MEPIHIPHRIVDFLTISHIVGIHYDEFGPNFCFKGEKHNFWEMVYVDKGQVHICTDYSEFDLEQGCIVFHKPNEFHTLSTDEKHPADVFVVAFVSTSDAMSFFNGKIIKVSPKLQKKIYSTFQEGLASFEYYNERFSQNAFSVTMKDKALAPLGGQQMFKIHLEELLIRLTRQETTDNDNFIDYVKSDIHNQIVEQIVSMIDGMVYEHINVNIICELTKYSRAYLARIFKSSLSMTVGEYITNAKINEAKKLIRQGKYTFQEIANMLKYENQHYFSKVFKKVTNFTPSQYKKSVL